MKLFQNNPSAIFIVIVAGMMSLWTGPAAWAAWLPNWDKRVKLTIDATDIDAALSDFPILIHLSTSSGRNADDVSFVFDELTSDANRKKIAVTKSDGTSQCYVEIEKWDDANEAAWLWINVLGTDSISSSTDTDLYLYYDANHADNTPYVGDSGSRTEVWDEDYVGVWHFENSWNDSTSNGNHFTTSTGDPTFSSSGQISSAGDFDGNDYYTTASIAHGIGTGDYTFESWTYRRSDTGQPYQGVVANGNYSPAMYVETAGSNLWGGYFASTEYRASNTINNLTWYYQVERRDSGTMEFYLDANLDLNSYSVNTSMANAVFRVGTSSDQTNNCSDAIIDEVRFSKTLRNAAWIKASHESGKDDLLDFGTEESNPGHSSESILSGSNF
jgi:hypothetical protein